MLVYLFLYDTEEFYQLYNYLITYYLDLAMTIKQVLPSFY